MNRENINTSAKVSLGYYEQKEHQPWFDEGLLLDERKFEWLQNPTELNVNNLNSIWHEASIHFGSRKEISER
jgi:hypothetical protein